MNQKAHHILDDLTLVGMWKPIRFQCLGLANDIPMQQYFQCLETWGQDLAQFLYNYCHQVAMCNHLQLSVTQGYYTTSRDHALQWIYHKPTLA